MPPDAVPASHRLSESLDEIIARRVEFLTAYQDAAYAERYAARIRRLRAGRGGACAGSTALTEAVARALFKLMAYKDEYEVARLYTETDFAEARRRAVRGRLQAALPSRAAAAGRARSRNRASEEAGYGPWMLGAFRLLARLRRLRGTAFDLFGRTAERRVERRLIAEYEAVLDEIERALSPENHAAAVELARLPLEIRGFGHVKEANLKRAKAREAELLARFRAPSPPALAAAE